jgi:thiol-disulfide isomerase/thioredoxin
MPIDRLVILAAFAALVLVAVAVGRFIAQRRLRQLQSSSSLALWNALGTDPDGRPTIVAFSTPGCAVCRTTQAPALQALEQRLGDASVRVVPVDAAERPEVADAFGVLTVPTTVVLAPSGRVAHANHGFAPVERLIQQIATATGG